MTELYLAPVLHLLRSADILSERIGGGLSAIHGLSLNEMFLLMHLENAPGHRLTRVELSKRLHISASTVTRMTAPMEKIKLVSRESDARDARLAFVVLTEAGLERVKDARATLARQSETVFQDRWTEKEINSLSELLGRLVANAPGDLI